MPDSHVLHLAPCTGSEPKMFGKEMQRKNDKVNVWMGKLDGWMDETTINGHIFVLRISNALYIP